MQNYFNYIHFIFDFVRQCTLPNGSCFSPKNENKLRHKFEYNQQITKLQMGNKSSQGQTISQLSVEELLQLYSPICQTLDEYLGKVKIYRKKQFNFDYVALTEKIMDEQIIQDCKNLLNLGKHQIYKLKKGREPSNFQGRIIKEADLWLKIFACQVSHKNVNDDKSNHLKLCTEYLNFSLKDYMCQYAMNLSSEFNLFNKNMYQNKVPRHVGYILGCILDAYCELRALHQIQPCINIQSMLSAITNPRLICVNLDGCLKFLPIPVFIFPDYYSNVDKCMVRCCKFANQDGELSGRNILIPKYGNTVTTNNQCSDKLDKIFVAKLKKFMKYTKNQMTLAFTTRTTDSSQQITSHVGSLESRGHLRIQSNQSNKGYTMSATSTRIRAQLSFWESLQYLNTVEQFINKIKSISNLPTNLQFGVINESGGKRQEKQKIRLQKYSKLKNNLNMSYNMSGAISHSNHIQTQKPQVQNQMRWDSKNDNNVNVEKQNYWQTNNKINVQIDKRQYKGVNTVAYGYDMGKNNSAKYDNDRKYAISGITSKQTSSQNSNIWNNNMGVPLL